MITFKDRFNENIKEGDVVKVLGNKNPRKNDSGVYLVTAVHQTITGKLTYIDCEGIEFSLFSEEVELYARKVDA